MLLLKQKFKKRFNPFWKAKQSPQASAEAQTTRSPATCFHPTPAARNLKQTEDGLFAHVLTASKTTFHLVEEVERGLGGLRRSEEREKSNAEEKHFNDLLFWGVFDHFL